MAQISDPYISVTGLHQLTYHVARADFLQRLCDKLRAGRYLEKHVLSLPRLALPCLIWLGSCASTSIDFTPYSVTTMGLPQLVVECKLGYLGDTSYLLDAAAIEVGTVYVSGNRYADQNDIRERAKTMCAENGGTHIIFLKKGESISYERLTPDITTISVSSDSVVARTKAGISVPVSRPNGEFRIFRVASERAKKLPIALQPEVFEQPYQSKDTKLPVKRIEVHPGDLTASKIACCRAFKLRTSATETECIVPSEKESAFKGCVRGQMIGRSTAQP